MFRHVGMPPPTGDNDNLLSYCLSSLKFSCPHDNVMGQTNKVVCCSKFLILIMHMHMITGTVPGSWNQ